MTELSDIDTREAWARYKLEGGQLNEASDLLEKELKRISRSVSPTCQTSVRIKSPRSYLGKLLIPGKASGEWPFVDDIVGGRVAFDSAREMKVALRNIQSSAAFSSTTVEVKSGSETELYYPGIHIIATLASPAYLDESKMTCEIQLRTKAQDAWSSVSHKLAYKAGLPLSARSKRKVWRLVALMELFDDEVDELLSKRAKNREYRVVAVLEKAEECFAELTGTVPLGPSHLDLATLLLTTYSSAEESALVSEIDDFVSAHRMVLQNAYNRFDPNSSAFDAYQDWLGLQPESLLVMERALRAPINIAQAVSSSALEEPVRAIFHALEVPWPVDE